MTGKENQLKRENQQLRNEIGELKKQLDKLTKEIGHRREEIDPDAGTEHGGDTVGKERSVELFQLELFQTLRGLKRGVTKTKTYENEHLRPKSRFS